MSSPNPRPNLMYDYKDWKHPPNGWRYSREMMAELDAKGLLWFPAKKDGRLMRKRYLDEQEGAPIGDVWTDISQIRGGDPEQLGYPTQKPLALLKRIVSASSSPGDVVLDPYCGCGTAVVAAHELGRRWIGIDITAVAVGVIKSRLEQHFDDLKGKVIVEGFPRDLESARSLFEQDKHRFQIWACTLIDAFPLTKKGADAGIDGWRNFVDYDDEPHRAVVQVKGGKSVQVKEVRDFCHVVEREGAAMGYFLVTCKADVTKPMQQEAVKMGYWTSVGKRDYPRVQILSVEGLLDGSEAPKLPPQDKASLLGYKAGAASKTGLQGELFGD